MRVCVPVWENSELNLNLSIRMCAFNIYTYTDKLSHTSAASSDALTHTRIAKIKLLLLNCDSRSLTAFCSLALDVTFVHRTKLRCGRQRSQCADVDANADVDVDAD